MENKDKVTVSDNAAVTVSGNAVVPSQGGGGIQEDADAFGAGTAGEDGIILEDMTLVDAADVAEGGKIPKGMLTAGIIVAAGTLLAAVLAVTVRRKRRAGQSKQELHNTPESDSVSTGEIQIGKIHHIGKRNMQQDSLGVTDIPDGVFAVVADGMGGLSDGDKVSQTVVMTMLQEVSEQSGTEQRAGLFEAVSLANDAVNQMLGMPAQYVSGSTVVAALAGKGRFEWVSVGDSRVCLYRGGRLIQLNREHNYESELLWQAVNGEASFVEAEENPRRRNLTSFIGMGKLKYVDGSIRPVEAAAGDILLLMSDGVFNTLSEDEICAVLEEYPEPQQAAWEMEERILQYDRPKQDNFTAVIMKFC